MIENLVTTIVTNLNNLNAFANMAQAERTMAVKTVLVQACNAIDDTVATFASPQVHLEVDGAEWLYDVTALLYDIPDENIFSGTILVAECEWRRIELEILNDFQKLLLARADVRVMVFDGNQPLQYQELFAIFQNNIANNKQAQLGDIWLFAAWTTDEGWIFRRIDVSSFLNVRDIEIE